MYYIMNWKGQTKCILMLSLLANIIISIVQLSIFMVYGGIRRLFGLSLVDTVSMSLGCG